MVKVYRLSQITAEELKALLNRSELDILRYDSLAEEVIKRVRREGDGALLHYTRQFDGISLPKDELKVPAAEIEAAFHNIGAATREALLQAAANIRKFHEQQLPPEMWLKEIEEGIVAGEKVTPISDVCLYIPRGKGSFPSVMLMLGIPALLAGVPRIAVCTPPGEGGFLETPTLAAAYIAGIREIYKVGGIQAIAAIAYGTETIPRCRKVIGPGNAYVAAAKRLLYGVLDVGLPAGPSEAIILADESTDPRLAALDLLIEAEHGPDSASLLVTHCLELAEKIPGLLKSLGEKLPEERLFFVKNVFRNYGGIVVTKNMDESIHFINDYAPEHLEILTKEPFSLLPRIKNAGEILLGPYAPITLGNFVLGPNAVLPTGSFAKTFSGVSVHDFLKRSSFAAVTDRGFNKVKKTAVHIAEAEGFAAHSLAVRERDKLFKSQE